jgi:hypothetical protein
MASLQTLPPETQMHIWGLAYAEVYIDCPQDFRSYQYSAVTAGIQRKLREARSRGRKTKLLDKQTYQITKHFWAIPASAHLQRVAIQLQIAPISLPNRVEQCLRSNQSHLHLERERFRYRWQRSEPVAGQSDQEIIGGVLFSYGKACERRNTVE